MELRQLRYFVAIAEEGSFTRAAERLWLAQPGLSTQIRRLEVELGIQLLERRTRGVVVTDAGQFFLERARIVLAAVEDARCTGHDLAAGLVGSIRLGIATAVPWPQTGELLSRFGRERPNVELTVVETYSGTLLRELRDGRLDAMIAPADFGSPELQRVFLGRARWLVLAGQRHRLAGEGAIAAAELHGERFLITGHRDGGGYDRAVADTLNELGIAAVLERGGAGPAIFAAVAAGEALALTTAPHATVSEMVTRPLSPVRRAGFALSWRDEQLSPALGQLIRSAQAGGDTSRLAEAS
jgi:DNA-binding transcriptional LysR family regulator